MTDKKWKMPKSLPRDMGLFDEEPPSVHRRICWMALLAALPCPLVGVLLGLVLGGVACRSAVDGIQARHPGEYVCGLVALPYLFMGLVGGGIVGIVAAKIVYDRVAARFWPEE